MRRSLTSQLIAALLLGLLAVTLLAPIYAVVKSGFVDGGEFTLDPLKFVIDDELFQDGLKNSVWLALFTTTLCLVISIPLAMLAESFQFAGKRIWLSLVLVPMILPPFVGAIGLKGLLSRNGGINLWLQQLGLFDTGQYIDWLQYPFWSCVVLEALYLYPITFLNVQAALANIDPALDEAARNLGSGAWRRFWRITLPLMRPGVFAGSTIVFIWSFTELGTPLMVGFREVTPVQVFDDLQTTNPYPETYALVVVMLTVSIVLYLIGKLLLGRPIGGMMAKATVASEPKRLRFGKGLLATLPFAAVFFIAVLPHLSVILMSMTRTGIIEVSPEHLTMEYHQELIHDVVSSDSGGGTAAQAAGSVLNSLKYSLIATAVCVVVGFGVGYLVVRRRSVLTGTLDSMAMLPLAVPGLVMAFGYFALTQVPGSAEQAHAAFGAVKQSLSGGGELGFFPALWGWVVQLKNWFLASLNPLRFDPTPLLVTSYTIRRLPFMVRSCAAGLEQTSEALEESAVNLGAGPIRTMWSVVVPLLMANFIAGGLLVFSRSMLEVSDSLILAFDQKSYPMTKAIYELADDPQQGLQMASALGVWGMLLLIVTILGASLALGKRLGALFRA